MNRADARAPEPMRVAFRVDGGSATIGMGHVARCAAMADALAARSAVIWFVCRDHENGVRYVRRRGFEVRAIPSTLALNEDLLQSIPLLADADLVVADSYEFDAAYLRGLAAAGKLIAAVTDVPDRELPVDIVIANAHATREEY